MPRPLRPPYTGGGVSIDVLLRQPKLGASIATISHLWAMIEMHMADIMLHTAGKAALHIYLSMIPLDMKLSALLAAIKTELPQDFQMFFIDKIQPEIRKRAKERNKIAHARWAENGAFPECIIMLPHIGDILSKKKSVDLYEEKDFTEIIHRITQTENIIRDFSYQIFCIRENTRASQSKA
jgi:hypothetical protein